MKTEEDEADEKALFRSNLTVTGLPSTIVVLS